MKTILISLTCFFFFLSTASFAQEEAENTFEIPEGVTAQSVIDKYIEVIGGAENIRSIEDRTTIMRGTVQGINITIVSQLKLPDKFKQEIKAGGMDQFVYFDGEKGVMLAAGNKIDITGAELEKLKYEATIPFMLMLDELNISTELTGVEEVDGKQAYRIEFTSPSGSKWSQYFDVESGFKLKEVKEISSPQATFNQETYFSDYKNIEGVSYPYSIKQNVGMQSLEFRVSSIKINSGLSDDIFVIKE